MGAGARAKIAEGVFQAPDFAAIPQHGSSETASRVTQSGVTRWTNASVRRFAADQDPIRCLEGGLTPQDWYALLNERVFFWLTEARLRTLLCAGAYRKTDHLVLTVQTRPIVEKYQQQIELSPMNSGCTKPFPHPRGPKTFQNIANYDYQFWKQTRRRKRGERVVELTVIGGVPDIFEYVVETSIRSCAGKYEVIYAKE